MSEFWKAAAAVLITVILCLAIGKQERDVSALLTMVVSCMTAMIAISYLIPVLDFLRQLEITGNLQEGMLDILLKAIGITLIAELAGKVCADAGYGSLGKGLQMLGNAAVLYLSIPIYKALLNLIQDILGAL